VSKRIVPAAVAVLLVAACARAQTTATATNDPFPKPINTTDDVVAVSFVEFASLPDVGGQAARMMLLLDEPGTRRIFVNDMFGILYSVSYDGKTVTPYLDLREPKWNVSVQSNGNERGFQSFAFHPQFSQPGTRGFGKFYTYTDTSNTSVPADFKPGGGNHTHDTILLEWTAKNSAAAAYDGGAPREVVRFEQPFANHNGGHATFNPLASPGSPDFGLLYLGLADGGSGGDPLNNAQNRNSPFGKILRVDPLGSNSINGKYGVPAGNPFVKTPGTLGEIYAVGVRNPQRFAWDSKTGNMFFSDIGQGTVEEVSPVTAGANLGWHVWEGSYLFVDGRHVDLANPRSDPTMTYPIVEYDHMDPVLRPCCAINLGYIYRQTAIPQLNGLLLFGDNPSGEVFYLHADNLPKGGQDAIRRVLFSDKGTSKNLLQLIRDKNAVQGKPPATRADLRFGLGPQGQIFILNKRDGTIRLLVK